MKIGWIENFRGKSGSTLVNRYAREKISKSHDVEFYNFFSGTDLLNQFKSVLKTGFLKGSKDIWCESIYSVALRNSPFQDLDGKKILRIHHLGTTDNKFNIRNLSIKIFNALLFKNIKKVDKIVTVSNYWREKIKKLGGEDISVIHNCLPVEKYETSNKSIKNFKGKYDLLDKPIIYLGKNQEFKGSKLVYKKIKDIDAHFVTTGPDEIKHSEIIDLGYLSKEDYVNLLHAADLMVLWSLFPEGWCIMAHESMLCGTPVVGNGAGGMEELLELGGQVVCKDIDKLEGEVKKALNKREKLGKRAKNRVSKLNLDYYERKWLQLLDEVKNGD